MRRAMYVCVLALAAACGGGGGGGNSGGGAGGEGGGTNAAGGGSGGSTLPETISSALTVSGAVDAPKTVTIAPTGALTLSPGATVTFAADVKLIVQGSLKIDGTSPAPVTLTSPGKWAGVLVEAGGTAAVRFAKLSNAASAFGTAAGAGVASFADSTIEASTQAMLLRSSADVQRVAIHNVGSGSVDNFVALNAGSPTLTDVRIDNGNGVTDGIMVNGGSPTLTRVTIRKHHCCVHTYAADDLFVDAYDCDATNSYGFMFYGSTKVTVVRSNITATVGVGAYYSNGTLNLGGNYWGGGAPAMEGTETYKVDAGNPAATPFDAGSRGP